MRISLRFKSYLAWIVFVETCLIAFLLVRDNSLTPSVNNVMFNSSLFDKAQELTEYESHLASLSTTKLVNDGERLNFSALPDLETTVDIKYFLENLHSLGYVGRNNSFQSFLEHLSVEQILANLLLKPESIESLKTVRIDLAMLTSAQIVECYIYSALLLHDLTFLLTHGEVKELKGDDINYVVGRLTYLNSYFKQELKALNAVS